MIRHFVVEPGKLKNALENTCSCSLLLASLENSIVVRKRTKSTIVQVVFQENKLGWKMKTVVNHITFLDILEVPSNKHRKEAHLRCANGFYLL